MEYSTDIYRFYEKSFSGHFLSSQARLLSLFIILTIHKARYYFLYSVRNSSVLMNNNVRKNVWDRLVCRKQVSSVAL